MSIGKRLLSVVVFSIVFFVSFAFAADEFVIRNIDVRGVQRITPSTVRTYMPVRIGETFTPELGNKIITTLYKTGFFSDVQLDASGNTLIVNVKERPIISLVQITGNKEITTDKLKPILKNLGIIEGNAFDNVKVNEIVQGLQQQYAKMGYRAASVTTQVVPEPRNRVSLYINVNEGIIAKVHSINIVGNKAFSQRRLRHQFKLTTPGILTWINHRDRYSPEKLQEDLQNLSEFYQNHGYLRFRVVSQQVTLSPDNKRVDITIYINEGDIYRISGFKVTGQTLGFDKQLLSLIEFKPGDLFSRQAILDSNKAIGDFMADRGYAFTSVNILPSVDDVRHQVYLTFNVVSGARVYVRRINFFGNQRTNEVVLRREMRQYEASGYSLSKIEESKRRLQLLGYFDDITVTPQNVPGHADQVDLNYHVKEVSAGRASVQGGYSDVYGFLYGASISEPNFMGSGKYVSLGFQNSQYSNYYAFTYNDPYYTPNGMSRGFSLYYSHMRPTAQFNFQTYLLDGYGLDVTYGLPISERNSIAFGYGYEHIAISGVNPANVAPSVLAFLGTENGKQRTGATYNQFKVTGGWTYNGLDRAIFPTKGFYTGLGLEVGVPIVNSSLDYYTATYLAKFYQPLFKGFIFNLLGTVAYGNGLESNHRLPFFKNFYAGGIGSVPAFSPNSLGPQFANNNLVAIGGNFEMVFGAHLILPSFTPKVRTAIIFDAGNVFEVPKFPADIPANGVINNNSVALNNLRPSLGAGVEWWSPFGPIDVTLAFPLNKRPGDQTQPFQFSFGVSL